MSESKSRTPAADEKLACVYGPPEWRPGMGRTAPSWVMRGYAAGGRAAGAEGGLSFLM